MDDFLNLLLPMIVVIIIIVMAYLTTKWIAKRQNSFTSGRIITILERVMLSKDVFLSVVKVDKKIYLISVSGGKTEMLAELPEEIADNYKTENKSTDFMSILKSFIDNKNKCGTYKGWNKKD